MSASRFSAPLVTALKYLVLALFLGYLVFTGLQGRESAVPLEQVSAAVTGAADLTPLTPGDNQMLRRLYGLDPETLDGFTLYCPTSSMAVEELCLIRLSDLSERDAVRQAMEARIESQIRSFEGYGPDQVAMLQRAAVEIRGSYALLVVADDPGPVVRAFRDALKGGARP